MVTASMSQRQDGSRTLRVRTASGTTYVLDPEVGTVCRVAGQGAGRLRRDGRPIPLLWWAPPVVGRPMLLVLRLRKGRLAVRTTTPVVRIDRLYPVLSDGETATS